MALRSDMLALADNLDRHADDIKHPTDWSRGVRRAAQAIRDQIALSDLRDAEDLQRRVNEMHANLARVRASGVLPQFCGPRRGA